MNLPATLERLAEQAERLRVSAHGAWDRTDDLSNEIDEAANAWEGVWDYIGARDDAVSLTSDTEDRAADLAEALRELANELADAHVLVLDGVTAQEDARVDPLALLRGHG